MLLLKEYTHIKSNNVVKKNEEDNFDHMNVLSCNLIRLRIYLIAFTCYYKKMVHMIAI